MLGIAEVSDDQVIVVKPAVKFSSERGVYISPVKWTGQTLMFCITRERLLQEFNQTVAAGSDIAAVFDPESYRALVGEGVYLDYYRYVEPEPGEKNHRAYENGVGTCYMTKAGERHTRADFLRLANGEEAVARRLFDLCDEQAPETLFDEELQDECMLFPVITFDLLSQETWMTFHPEQLAPNEVKRALLQQAGWQESHERRWTHQGRATVPQGIAYVTSKHISRTVNIEPTPSGYRRIKQLFQESLQTYQEKLHHLDLLLMVVQPNQFGEATGDVHALLEGMVAEKRATIEDAVESLTGNVDQLERCGY